MCNESEEEEVIDYKINLHEGEFVIANPDYTSYRPQKVTIELKEENIKPAFFRWIENTLQSYKDALTDRAFAKLNPEE
jgi:hypothetical protein